MSDTVTPTVTAPAPAAAPASDLVDIAGKVTRLHFQSEKFCAGKFAVRGRDVSFKIRGYVRAGEPITLRGRWVVDPKYGKQFEAVEVVYVMPTDTDGVRKWLEWYAPSVGPVKAQKLLDEFGDSLMRLCGEDPGQVAACAGIPIECVHRVAAEWAKHSGRIAAASTLAGWGLTQLEVETLLATLGNGAISLVQEDPFAVLGRVDGFGWVRTDSLAAKIGIVGDDPRRVRGAVAAVVREQYGEGSTAVTVEAACEMADDKLGLLDRPRHLTQAVVDAAVENKQLVRTGDWLSTPWGHTCEANIWRVLDRSRDLNPHTDTNAMSAVDLAQKYRRIGNVELDESQVFAVASAALFRISVVTGGAGAGKTLVARSIFKLFDDGDIPVSLCAPTGKAARRLEEVIGKPAQTIHRLLEFGGGNGLFNRNEKNPLPPGVVIADEASMIDSEIGYRLLTALGPQTALVLIGDQNQLPPVGAGALLRDVLAHDLAPVTRLEKCHRQAGTLKRNCVRILEGHVEPWAMDEPDPCPWIVTQQCDTPAKVLRLVADLYAKWLPKWGYDPLADVQIMTAKHDGAYGTRRLNLLLQRLHQKTLGNDLPEVGEDDHHQRATLHAGDKVIQTRNNYELGVMNGSIGVVMQTAPALFVDFEGKMVGYQKGKENEVQLAYVLTPHKCQGSEFPCAVLIVPKSHSFMMHRNWFYTGVTRAKKTAVIVGDPDGIRRAVETVKNDQRQTLLGVWAKDEGARP